MRIRPMAADDLPAVHALNESEVPGVGHLELEQLEALAASCSPALVAVDDSDGIVGFALALPPGRDYLSVNYQHFEARPGTHLYVDRVVVARQARRQGIAGALYDALSDHARDAGLDVLACEVNTWPRNGPSLAFHAARGFVEVGRQRVPESGVRVSLMVAPVAEAGPDRPPREPARYENRPTRQDDR